MKWVTSTRRVKQIFLSSILSLVFTFGIIGNVSARPMFGSDSNCGNCTLGTTYCIDYVYVLWIKFENGGHHEPC